MDQAGTVTMAVRVSPLCGNFLMLHTPFTIDGKPAQAGCDDRGWLTFSTGSPNVGITFDSFTKDIDEVLKNNGMEGISNYWCNEAPLFQIKASSQEDIKKLIRLLDKIRGEMASKIAAKLGEKLPPSDYSIPHVEVCPEVYIMIPNYHKINVKLLPVKGNTLTMCMSLCAENGLLDFGARFETMHSILTKRDRGSQCLYSPVRYKGPENLLQLEIELKEVINWFHLGIHLEVPWEKLMSFQMAHPEFPERCRSEVFQYYMQMTVDKNWLTIVQALARIGHVTLAIKIARKYGVPVSEVDNSKFTGQGPDIVSTEVDGTSQKESKPELEIQKLRGEIAQKDEELDRKEQALRQARQEKMSLTQQLTSIIEKKREVEKRTEELKLDRMRLEENLQSKDKEIHFIKESSEKDSALVREMIAMKEKECEDIKARLERFEDKTESEKEKVSYLLKEKLELQTKLSGRDHEIQHLKKSLEDREKYINYVIVREEQVILEHKNKLKKKEEELESEKKKNACLQERFHAVTKELEVKRVEVKNLHEIKEALYSQLKLERERVDKLLMKSMPAKASSENHATKTVVIKSQLQPLTWPIPLIWKRKKDLPFGVQFAHTVLLNGQIHIGGGSARDDNNKYIVMKYDSNNDEWSLLPKSSVRYFAMASVKDQLLLAGGEKGNAEIQLLDNENHHWTSQCYPKMRSGRSFSAAVGYKNFLIVLCGDYKDTVEILDSSTHHWYSAPPVPMGGDHMTAIILSNDIYISSYAWSDGKPHIFSAQLPTLISNATNETTTSPTWHELLFPPVCGPTLLGLQNHLLLVGGEKQRKEFYRYCSEQKNWIECGQLPVAMLAPCCAVLPSGELLVAGGAVEGAKGYSQYVWVGSYK